MYQNLQNGLINIVNLYLSSGVLCKFMFSVFLCFQGGSTCFCVPTSQQSNFTVNTARVLNWTTCDNSDTPDTCGGVHQGGQGIASLYGDSAKSGLNTPVKDCGNLPQIVLILSYQILKLIFIFNPPPPPQIFYFLKMKYIRQVNMTTICSFGYFILFEMITPSLHFLFNFVQSNAL